MKQLLIKNIHAILKPLGFKKKTSTWNRAIGEFIDVVNVQRSQWSSNITINFSVVYIDAYKKCWIKDEIIFFDEANGTIRSRLGELVFNHDKWWDLSDESMLIEIPQLIQQYGLPFLDKLHSIDVIEDVLEQKLSKRVSPHPPEDIYLAIIKAKKGDFNAAYTLLDKFESCISEGWKIRAKEIKASIQKLSKN